MASWDSPVVNGPQTANYAPPVQDFSGFANLLQDFVKGREAARGEDKARAFRNGIPRDSNGDPDFNKISDTAARVGGIDYALPLLNLQVQRDAGAGNGAAIAQAQGVATGQPAAAPAAQRTRAPAPPQRQPEAPSTPTTVMTILAAQGIPNNQLQAASESVARQIGVGVTDPIDTKDPRISNILGPAIRFLKKNRIGEVVSEAPASAGLPAAAPSPTPNERVAQSVDAAPVASGDMATADRLDLAAAGLRQRAAATANLNPKGADALIKQADAYGDRAKQIREQVGTSNQPAPAIKEWRQSGSKLPYDEWVAQAEGSKETAKEDAKANAKKYEAIVENGTKAQVEIPQLELMQQQMDDPNFFSGSGEKYNLMYKRLKSAVGIDPEAPVPQEMLRKITSSNILSSLGALKGLGQIRVAEINLAKDAAASPDNSVPANKFLVEVSKRMHQRNAEIAEMAQAYKEQNGALDAGFDKKVTAFYKANPMFSDAEIKDWHKIIGAPAKAAAAEQGKKLQTFASPSAVAAAKLPSGTRFLDSNGVERMVP